MIYENFFKDNLLWICLGGGILIVLIFLIIVLIVLKKKPKKPKLIIDREYVEKLLCALGGKSNINAMMVDGNKLKVNVKNVNATDLDALKELAQSGVFVTGNDIKTLYMYDSEALKEELKKYKG